MNGAAFAVLGALLWYALYRRSWAWYALAGLGIIARPLPEAVVPAILVPGA